MANNDPLPKVEGSKSLAVDASTLEWMKIIEKENLERVQKLKKIRSRNFYTGLFLGGTVLSIYAYSILSVKQETFLDDFEEPKLVLSKETSPI